MALVTGGLLWHQANIDGHWHIVSRAGVGFSGLYTFDVKDYDDPYASEEDYGTKVLGFNDHLGLRSGIGGMVHRLNREVYVHPTCFGMHLRYQRWGDSLYLKADLGEAIAFRCNDDCCDPQLDLFTETELRVDLPVRKNEREFDEESFNIGAAVMSLVVGKDATGTFVPQYLYGNRRFQSKDVPLFVEQHLVKLPERLHSQVSLRLYADRETPQAVMDSIASVFLAVRPDLGVERVYRQEKLERPLRLYLGE